MLHAAPKHIIALRAMQQRLWTGGGRLPSASVCAVLRVASTCIVRKGSKVAVVSPDALANRACSQPNDTVRKAAGPAPRVRPWLFVVVVAVAVVQGRPGPMYYVNEAPQDRPQQRPGQLVHVQDKAPSTRPSGGGARQTHVEENSRICEGGCGCGTQTSMATGSEGAGGKCFVTRVNGGMWVRQWERRLANMALSHGGLFGVK